MNLKNNFKFSDNREFAGAYVITLHGNETSMTLARRCQQSCVNHNIRSFIWPAFDGTDKENVIIPNQNMKSDWVKWIKIPNNKYSTSQIACFFSHVSLWAECATIDQPIIILEHDAICVEGITHHNHYNCIQYLGSKEQTMGSPILTTPPHASIYGGQWRSICRAHAYAIDPPIARNLLSYVIREGMTKTLDMFIRADIFPIVQNGLYFYDERGTSTIQELEDYSEDC